MRPYELPILRRLKLANIRRRVKRLEVRVAVIGRRLDPYRIGGWRDS